MDNTDNPIITYSESEKWVITPSDLESVRASIKKHIALKKSLSGIIIEPNAPPRDMPFRFIHVTPELRDNVTKDEWYRCSYCERDQQFKIDGRIVYCGDKKLRLIGNECHKKHFSKDEYEESDKEYKAYQRRQQFNDVKDHFMPAVARLRESIKGNRNNIKNMTAFISGFPSEFRQKFPDLTTALNQSLKNNGALTVDYYVHHLDGKSEARIETLARFKGELALKQEEKSISQIWDEAFQEIAIAEYHFQNTDWENLSNRKFSLEMDVFNSRCQHAIELVNRVKAKVKAIIVFLSINNMTAITHWANNHNCELRLCDNDGEYKIIHKGLRFSRNDGISEIALPNSVQILIVSGLEELEGLLK